VGLAVTSLQQLLAARPPIQRLIVAYSGGVDSHVLLHLLATQRDALDGRLLAAIHVDHGLHPDSRQWAMHCQQVCRELDVSFSKLRVDARPLTGESPEAVARRARYQALEELLDARDALLTAHHRDDQAETLLLQLLRGSGPHGLAAMPMGAPLGRGWLLRPLLDADRTEILAYARDHDLAWVEDSSNADQNLDRNYLRHAILPHLKARWPEATRSLARSARWCAETAELLDARADEDLVMATAGRPDCLNIPMLRTLDEARQRNALRRWFRHLQLPSPTAPHLRHILHDAIAVARDRRPLIHWPGGEVRRYREHLFAMAPLPPHDPTQAFALAIATALSIPHLGRLRLHPAQGAGVLATALAGRSLTVRFRRGGERFRPVGRRHGQELKKLLQEAGVPPWERDRLPLLYVDERLAVVAGLWVAADLAAGPDAAGLVLEWQKPSASDNV